MRYGTTSAQNPDDSGSSWFACQDEVPHYWVIAEVMTIGTRVRYVSPTIPASPLSMATGGGTHSESTRTEMCYSVAVYLPTLKTGVDLDLFSRFDTCNRRAMRSRVGSCLRVSWFSAFFATITLMSRNVLYFRCFDVAEAAAFSKNSLSVFTSTTSLPSPPSSTRSPTTKSLDSAPLRVQVQRRPLSRQPRTRYSEIPTRVPVLIQV